jgi:hypothetical protein
MFKWLVGLATLTACAPRYTTVQVASGRSYDVISVKRDRFVGTLYGAEGKAAGEALLVNYFAPLDDGVSETYAAYELMQFAMPKAQQYGDSLIVFEQIDPIISNRSTLFGSHLRAYRLNSNGNWAEL